MPDTYFSFVIGYSVFVLILIGITGGLLAKVLKLEKEICKIRGSENR